MTEDARSREDLLEELDLLRARTEFLERQLAERRPFAARPEYEVHYRMTLDRIAGSLVSTRRKSRMLEEIRWAFDADRAVLMYPCSVEAIAFTAPAGADRAGYEKLGGARVVLDATPQSRALSARALRGPGAFTAACTEPEFVDAPAAAWFGIRSVLGIAVHPEGGRHPWLLTVQQCSHERHWTEEEKRLLEDVAATVALPLGELLIAWEADQARFLPLFSDG